MNHPPLQSAVSHRPIFAPLHGAGSLCRLCSCKLRREDGDDIELRLCGSCKNDPDAQDLLPLPALSDASLKAPTTAVATAATQSARSPFANMVADVTGECLPVPALARSFNDADLALIRRIGAFMPMHKLLNVLNERRACDLGTDKEPYSIEQLAASIAELHGAKDPTALGRDWPSLRKLLAQARRAGVLELINEQVIDDFAVVFQLNAKQVVELKDIVLGAKED